MNTQAASFNRYWEPNYLQATSISLIAGTIASYATYPFEYLKNIIQYQGTGIGFRGRYCKLVRKQSRYRVTTPSKC